MLYHFEIENLKKSDVGIYTCQIINADGVDEKAVVVNILSGPKWIAGEANIKESYTYGDNIRRGLVRCVLESNPKSPIDWYKDGSKLEQNELYNWVDAETEFNSISSIELLNLQEKHQGTYQCKSRNHLQFESGVEFEINFIEPVPPRITTRPENVRSPVGDTIILFCEAIGEPTPTIRWTKNGQLVQLDDRIHLTDEGFLQIEDVNLSDDDYYGCHARNSAGRVSLRAKLSVFDPRLERENSRNIQNGAINDAQRRLIKQASHRVLLSVNRTISSLLQNKDKDQVPMRDLFALGKFPPTPSLANAVAAEVFEDAAELAGSSIDKDFLGRSHPFQSDLLTRENIDQLKELAGCVHDDREVDCDSNFCFHQRFRSHNG